MSIAVEHNVSLAPLTTMGVGGAARNYVCVHDEAELVAAAQYAAQQGLPVVVLGGGSNVLIADAGTSALVIHNHITERSIEMAEDEVLLTAGAGELLDDIVAETVQAGWWGIENLSHIPGSVGATPVQNVGAYGVEVADVIDSVRVYDLIAGTFANLVAADCGFGYRDSMFKRSDGKRYVIVSVTYRLTTKTKPQLSYRDLQQAFPEGTDDIQAVRAAVIDIRAKKFPDWTTVGTAGSFFKNPIIPKTQYEALLREYPELPAFPVTEDTVKVPLGYILDKILQYRGAGTDTVGSYEGQALVLINKGGATAADIVAFATEITEAVKAALQIDIEWEVTQIDAFVGLKIGR